MFCLTDDFYQAFALEWEKRLLVDGHKNRCRATFLCLSELITLAVLFYQLALASSIAFISCMRNGFCVPKFRACPVNSVVWNCCPAALFL